MVGLSNVKSLLYIDNIDYIGDQVKLKFLC